MKIFILYLFILVNNSQQKDFHISIRYYSKPIISHEWSISIFRVGGNIYINALDYMDRTINKKEIPRRYYPQLIDRLNKCGIWILKDYYRKGSHNGYYLIRVEKGRHHNSIRVEAGVPLLGQNARYLEIIRSVENVVRVGLYD
ncbi:MAG: hypothetical protein SVZ03_13185 [Spirochaetota bacterium]|nr:hypothetical protein [Spirochaetota bacterium]